LRQKAAIGNAEYGIRANVIMPGLIDTPMAVDTRARVSGKSRAEVAAARDAKVPLRKRMGTAWDVANAALFLASDEANFITGVALPVDGGALGKIGSPRPVLPATRCDTARGSLQNRRGGSHAGNSCGDLGVRGLACALRRATISGRRGLDFELLQRAADRQSPDRACTLDQRCLPPRRDGTYRRLLVSDRPEGSAEFARVLPSRRRRQALAR